MQMKVLWMFLVIISGQEIAFAKANPPMFSSGRYNLSYTLEPTDAFREMIAKRVAEKEKALAEMEKKYPDKDHQDIQFLKGFMDALIVQWNRKLTFDMNGNMARDDLRHTLLVMATDDGDRSAVFKLVSKDGRVFGNRNWVETGWLTFPHLETFQIVGTFKDSTHVNGKITWIVDGIIYGRGTFNLRYLNEKKQTVHP